MSGRRAELQGSYKNSKRPGYLKVDEKGRASWREGGRKPSENCDFISENSQLEYGEFKPAEKVLRETSGLENYNFRPKLEEDGRVTWSKFGIMSGDGEKLFYLDNIGTGVEIFQRITDEEATELGWCSEPELS